jgi:hypothetical protein
MAVLSLAPLPPLPVLERFDDAGYRVTSLTSVDADEERADPDKERGRNSLELRLLLGFLEGELGKELGSRSGEMLERPERLGVDSEKYEENKLDVTERTAFGEWSSAS